MTSVAADDQRGAHQTLGEMNPTLRDKSKQWTLPTARKRLEFSVWPGVEGGEFKETKEQKLLVYLLSGNYYSMSCAFSKEGREGEEEGEAEAGMLEAVQRVQRGWALPISTTATNRI